MWLRTTVPYISLRLTLSKKRRRRQRKRRRRLQPRKSIALNTKEQDKVNYAVSEREERVTHLTTLRRRTGCTGMYWALLEYLT